MKRFMYFFLVVFLVLACGDQNLVQVEDELALTPEQPELTVAAAEAGMKMVPFRGSGHWWGVPGEIQEREEFDCEAMGGLFLDHGAGQTNVTHLGRSEYDYVNCWGVEDILYQTGFVTGANGAQVTWHATLEEGLRTVTDWENGTYEMGPMVIDGGTGRFEGVVGTFQSYGTFWLAESGWVGTELWEGVISSVGSSK